MIVGVAGITEKLKDGQKIQMDGSSGIISVLKDEF